LPKASPKTSDYVTHGDNVWAKAKGTAKCRTRFCPTAQSSLNTRKAFSSFANSHMEIMIGPRPKVQPDVKQCLAHSQGQGADQPCYRRPLNSVCRSLSESSPVDDRVVDKPCARNLLFRKHGCIYVCIHTYIHTCVYAYLRICIYTFMYEYIHMCIYTHMHDWFNNHPYTETRLE
jgi:hypothetical protein